MTCCIVHNFVIAHRENDPVKLDDTSKSGRDSSEVELESLGDNTKLDQFSEGMCRNFCIILLNVQKVIQISGEVRIQCKLQFDIT